MRNASYMKNILTEEASEFLEDNGVLDQIESEARQMHCYMLLNEFDIKVPNDDCPMVRKKPDIHKIIAALNILGYEVELQFKEDKRASAAASGFATVIQVKLC